MDIENGKISMSGWLPSGRRVYFEQPSTGDLQRDISLAVLMDRAMTEGGLAVREQGVEAGEQTREIRALLRRKHVNKETGAITPVIDAYSGKFRWLMLYLNTPEDEAAFEKATGMKYQDMPFSLAEIKEYNPRDPDHARVMIELPAPITMVYRDNPAYDANETDISKKKPARLFVRWLTAAPAPVVSTPPQMPANTQQAAKTLGSGDQGRRIPVDSENAANAGFSPILSELVHNASLLKIVGNSNHLERMIKMLASNDVYEIGCKTLDDHIHRTAMYIDERARGTDHEKTPEAAMAAVKETVAKFADVTF